MKPVRQEDLDQFPLKRGGSEKDFAELKKIWCAPKGWEYLTAVNNNYIGFYYITTAFVFFLLAGLLSVIMRVQLAAPAQELVSPETYNQLFTMHGTVMMFLFAVPAVEAAGVLLLPQMIGARDLPFPRLSAYAYWIYVIGGLAFFSSIFFSVAPDGGWFMYPPLTGRIYSPGVGADFWLLGIGFIEISAIAGAIEFIVGIMKTRAPGMTLDKMPILAWALLVFSVMILVAFPSVILCTLLLELERAFNMPFFDATRGGDPLLWQHLLRFFGHPEVYIIFLPAAAMLTMVISATARSDVFGYPLVVLAMLATGFISFGVWAHHMFTTGIPDVSVGMFSAASTAVTIPAGILVFSWIATLAAGSPKLNVPGLFSLGSIIIFVTGGLTGVMVALVPFDLQAHDTYFVVAHLHYVLLGGAVFPLFAAIYYWTPMMSRRALSERLGKSVFWLMFVGTHVTFLPMHVTGLMGMPRRVYTYLPNMQVGTLNFISTMGAFLLSAGIVVFFVDLIRNFRFSPSEKNAGNIYGGGTLEWLPTGLFSSRSIPVVKSRQPLWDTPKLYDDVEKGRYLLPRSATGGRETLVTHPITALPEQLLTLPGPSPLPLISGVFTSVFFLLLTVGLYTAALVSGFAAIATIIRWVWQTDRPIAQTTADIGGSLMVPTSSIGRKNHGVWAMLCVLVVLGMIFVMALFGLVFLWTNQPRFWIDPPSFADSVGTLAMGSLSLIAALAARMVLRLKRGAYLAAFSIVFSCVFMIASLWLDAASWQSRGLSHEATGQGAIVYGFVAHQASLVFVGAIMAGYALARASAGLITLPRSVFVDIAALFLLYTAVQGLATIVVTRLLGAWS
jgi:cytochrome c oxidase subunit I+III